MDLSVHEIARSIELYQLAKQLHHQAVQGKTRLEFTREPFLRERKDLTQVVVAFGSYDPLSKAHEALFLKGLAAAPQLSTSSPENSLTGTSSETVPLGTVPLDELLLVASTAHFDKRVSVQENSTLYDRVHALEGFASCYGNIALAFFNSPLFVDLQRALQEAYSEKTKISFLLGVDVMQKVVDLQGYAQRGLDGERIVRRLLQSHFFVCERSVSLPGEQGRGEREERKVVTLAHLQEKYPLLQEYATQVHPLTLDDFSPKEGIPLHEVSSTFIRQKRSRGEDARDLEALGVSDFVERRKMYLRDSTFYAAFVSARERFADEHSHQPLASYLPELMEYLQVLESDPVKRDEEIARGEVSSRERFRTEPRG